MTAGVVAAVPGEERDAAGPEHATDFAQAVEIGPHGNVVHRDRHVGMTIGEGHGCDRREAEVAEIIKAGDFDLPNLELAIDYVLGGVHAALIAVAHTPASRRSRATSDIADLVVGTLA
jgi:hypothetical protein